MWDFDNNDKLQEYRKEKERLISGIKDIRNEMLTRGYFYPDPVIIICNMLLGYEKNNHTLDRM
jgi:3-hydroxymyristoyl/3-hydroxydecanoyl-(acyl carrier protein) dehydratase